MAYVKIIVKAFMQRNCKRARTTSARIAHAMTDILSGFLRNVLSNIEILAFVSSVNYGYPECGISWHSLVFAGERWDSTWKS